MSETELDGQRSSSTLIIPASWQPGTVGRLTPISEVVIVLHLTHHCLTSPRLITGYSKAKNPLTYPVVSDVGFYDLSLGIYALAFTALCWSVCLLHWYATSVGITLFHIYI